IESVHFGDAVVVDSDGAVIMQIGNPDQMTYMRSTTKPFQAIPVLMSGAFTQFGFTDQELAIACASHYAEDIHLRVVRNMLKKTGCSESDLKCGITPPLKLARAFELVRAGVDFSQIHSDCSGKHVGMLAACKASGWSPEDYTESGHPLQKQIKEIISAFTGIPSDQLITGTDGCTVPTFYLSVYSLARAYSRLVSPTNDVQKYMEYTQKIVQAMTAHPEMLSGSGGFCSTLTQVGQGRWIGKIGAEGVYAVGIREGGIGIGLKIANGSMEVIPPVIVEIMKRLGVLSSSDLHALKSFVNPVIKDDRGRPVGKMEVAF
ncbi:MAG: asparaginase, partial [Methanobacteriota archaeon]